jgi:two-component system response regulator GlrR
VRELRAYVEQAISSRAAAPEDAPSPPLVDASIPLRELRRRWIDYFEHAYVAELLARTGGKITAAAQLAGVDRVYMHRLVTRTGLRDQLKGVREG